MTLRWGWEVSRILRHVCISISSSVATSCSPGALTGTLDKWLGKWIQTFEELVVGETISNGFLLLEDWRRLRRVWQPAFHLLMEKEVGSAWEPAWGGVVVGGRQQNQAANGRSDVLERGSDCPGNREDGYHLKAWLVNNSGSFDKRSLRLYSLRRGLDHVSSKAQNSGNQATVFKHQKDPQKLKTPWVLLGRLNELPYIT